MKLNPAASHDLGTLLWGIGEPADAFPNYMRLLDKDVHPDEDTIAYGWCLIEHNFNRDCANSTNKHGYSLGALA